MGSKRNSVLNVEDHHFINVFLYVYSDETQLHTKKLKVSRLCQCYAQSKTFNTRFKFMFS